MSVVEPFVHKFDALCPRCKQPWGSHPKRHEIGFHCARPIDPILELAALLREAGLQPYFHQPDCATWKRGACDRDCAPTAPSSEGEKR